MKYTIEEGYGAGFLLEHYMKYHIKDSVFRMLFSDPKYRLELYRVLLPDEMNVKEDELEDSTIKNYLINGQHNDIAFRKADEFLVLTEAQDTWSLNILLRMLFYAAEIFQRIVHKDKKDVFSSAKAEVPEPIFYVIYTGSNKKVYGEYSLADEFFPEKRRMDLRIDVINKGPRKGDIVDQYIDFTKEVHDIIDEKGIVNITADDVEALVKRCIRKGILAEFLTERLTEVTTLMHKIFNEDYYLKSIKSDGYAEGMVAGKAEGITIGEAKGKESAMIQVAKNLFKAGVNLDVISNTTGLKPSYIQSLV